MKPVKLSVFVLCFSMAACAIPDLVPSAPASDPNAVNTMIVGTAQAFAAQTVSVVETSRAEQPLATPTAVPVTETPAASPTPTLVFSAYGTALNKQADGSTLFVDQQLGYQLVMPAGWTVFRINEPEFFDLWSTPVATDLAVQRSLTTIQGMNPDVFRLFAFDLRDGHRVNDGVTNMQVLWNQGVSGSFDEIFDQIEDSTANLFPEINRLSSTVETTTAGLEVGIIEFEIKGNNIAGNQVTVYEKQAVVKVQAGVLSVQLDVADELKDLVLSEFDQVKESITLLSQ